ncbi:DUF3344 domain-containing protein [Streptomyces albipurpureus]|uniref:DUF3344 domain-containing protein n=1 Tax=Streptomyces albipurpureus TaxID=2897419 RepID=A0ABT0UKR8_9ACTN|nr:DUF3344 domain-containing protein [Streptomyces sp. CWNU-1]MCM2389212.1 DUF3344 domain-containing protein [Streptomyces sp. CWNU-1]
MSTSMGFAARGFLGALLVLAFSASPLPAAGAPVAEESSRIPFTQRYQAVQHGGVVRTANSAITCRTPKSTATTSCSSVRTGSAGTNGDFEMFYIDEDDDPNTYNSSRADLALPKNSRVSYARLYWGGNLRVGEQKPPKDNGRILIAEPGGKYKEVLADTRIAHRDTDDSDAFQASADITPLVSQSGSGLYTVAQINVAMGHSAVGSWGGWTMVVAYENSAEPLRQVSIWDGFETMDDHRKSQEVVLSGLRIPARATGRVGIVSYDGDRGAPGDAVNVQTDKGKTFGLTSSTNPATDVMNSTIAGPGNPIKRQPAHVNTLGYDSDVFDIGPALTSGGSRLNFRFNAENLGYFLGVLFVQADTRR